MGSRTGPGHSRGGVGCASLIVALAIGLAGCGSSSESITSKSATAIIAASRAAAEKASSVHVVSMASVGKVTLSSNLQLADDSGRSSLSLGRIGYQAIRIGNTLYVKGTPALSRQLAARTGVHVPLGAWLKGSAETGALERFAPSTDLQSKLGVILTTSGQLAKGPSTIIDGQHVIELKEAAKLFKGSIYIATTGQPYPVTIVKHGHESGQTSFSGWNEALSLVAPSNAIDVDRLTR